MKSTNDQAEYSAKREAAKPAILIVHCRYRQRGGEDTAVDNEIKLLKKYGHRVLFYERSNEELFLPHSVIFSIKTFFDIKKIIKKEKIDIIHVHNTWMAVSRSVFYAAIVMGVPIVQTLHNFRLVCPNAILFSEGKRCRDCLDKGMMEAVKKKCYRGSAALTLLCLLESGFHRRTGICGRIYYICLSEFNKEIISKYIDPERIFVKPNFIRPMISKAQVNDNERKGFIFAGRLTEEKGIRLVIRAWKLMGDAAPRLQIFGRGPLTEWCKNEIEVKHLNASLGGEVSRDVLMNETGKSEALIFSSVCYEGFPMTVLEALSVGTPVIASDIGNGRSMIEEGKNGLLFNCGSAKDLARAVADISKGKIIFDNGNITVPEECRPQENYRILNDIYDRICSFP